MKKKALSFDEKRERLLNIFHEKKEVFNLKELEKLGGKAGIVPQTVKDVLDSLVNDNLVETDKIGSGNFFWSLPSKTYQSLANKVKEYEEGIQKMQDEKENIELKITDELLDKEDSEDRGERLKQLAELKKLFDQKTTAIEKYKRNDPDRLKQLEKEAKEFQDKANKWTDNIFVTKQWICGKNPACSDADLNRQFEIPEDLDTI